MGVGCLRTAFFPDLGLPGRSMQVAGHTDWQALLSGARAGSRQASAPQSWAAFISPRCPNSPDAAFSVCLENSLLWLMPFHPLGRKQRDDWCVLFRQCVCLLILLLSASAILSMYSGLRMPPVFNQVMFQAKCFVLSAYTISGWGVADKKPHPNQRIEWTWHRVVEGGKCCGERYSWVKGGYGTEGQGEVLVIPSNRLVRVDLTEMKRSKLP